MKNSVGPFTVVVPAAGIGKRMRSSCPKQYLTINEKTVLTHTVERLLSHSEISHVVIALGEKDEYFSATALSTNPNVTHVVGGKERVDSVLAGLQSLPLTENTWVLVHDAARPCVLHSDLTKLIQSCLASDHGGILATPVRDTMKQVGDGQLVTKTLDRSKIWHALTPQMFKTSELISAITHVLENNLEITDESSAMEACGYPSNLVMGSSDNIKITQPEDLRFAEFILNEQMNKHR